MVGPGLELPSTRTAQRARHFHCLFVHDALEWVTLTAQSHPYWVLSIAFAVAFSESVVGVAFIIPRARFCCSPLGYGDRATSIGPLSGVGGDHRFVLRLESLVVDRLSLHHTNRCFRAVRAFEGRFENKSLPLNKQTNLSSQSLVHLGDLHRPLHGNHSVATVRW